jgi:hypothetical protein
MDWNDNAKLYLFLVIVVMAIVIAVLAFFILYKSPTSMTQVTLSPSAQPVFVSLYQPPSFKVAIASNGSIKFSCSLTLFSSMNVSGGSSSWSQPVQVISKSGTYNFNMTFIPPGYQANLNQLTGRTVSCYVEVVDSNGLSIRSNTVTVKYR